MYEATHKEFVLETNLYEVLHFIFHRLKAFSGTRYLKVHFPFLRCANFVLAIYLASLHLHTHVVYIPVEQFSLLFSLPNCIGGC